MKMNMEASAFESTQARGGPRDGGQTRAPLCALLLALLAGCHAGVDERRIQGEWVARGETLRFTPGGEVLWSAPGRAPVRGTYWKANRNRILVDLDTRWISGEPKLLHAYVRSDRLGLCELPNLRHCFQYHRPGAPVTFVPR
jgi:hypothetical protein